MDRGFSLIEILIYIAIIGLMIGAFASFVLAVNNSRSKNYVVSEVQANTRVVLDILSQKIHSADTVLTPSAGNSAGSLVLDMPDPEPDLTFQVQNGVLSLKPQGGGATNITGKAVNVSYLNFTNLAGLGEKDNIRIQMTIEFRNPESKEYEYSQTIETAVSRRH